MLLTILRRYGWLSRIRRLGKMRGDGLKTQHDVIREAVVQIAGLQPSGISISARASRPSELACVGARGRHMGGPKERRRAEREKKTKKNNGKQTKKKPCGLCGGKILTAPSQLAEL